VKKYTVPKEFTGTRNITLHIAETASSSKVYIDDEPIKKWMNGYRFDDGEENSCFLILEQERNGTVYVRINGELVHIAGKPKSIWVTKLGSVIDSFINSSSVTRLPIGMVLGALIGLIDGRAYVIVICSVVGGVLGVVTKFRDTH
jgi:hypothetical protein